MSTRYRQSWRALSVVVITAVAVGSRTAAVQPSDRVTVFIAPGSHFDLGFTAPLSEVREARVRILDLALDAAERDPAFVWFEEAGWTIETWLDRYRCDPARIERLRSAVMRGQIGVGATLLSPHAAAFPEALPLLTIHLDRVERELGRRPSVAVLNDVPSVAEAMVDALSEAGVRYLLMGANMSFTPPLPASLVRRPFYWESARGRRVLTFVDPDGFTTGFSRWGLPPDCARFFNPAHFPSELDDDAVIERGVRSGLALFGPEDAVILVQHALDNWDTRCARRLPSALRRWNDRNKDIRLVLANPESYFRELEARHGGRLPVRRGEWGGDWDIIRASEPVWTWRLRQVLLALPFDAPHADRVRLVGALDHNVGLGPRWVDGMPEQRALQHVGDVAALYRRVVYATLGDAGLTALPPALHRPATKAPATEWPNLVGDLSRAVRVRAGPGFLYELVTKSAPTAPVPVHVEADDCRLLARTRLDRIALERSAGREYRAVIEVRLRARSQSLTMAPEGSASARAGVWLRGEVPRKVVAPEGVRIAGPSVDVTARGPLLLAWALAADADDPDVTWLQALALSHSVEGTIQGGRMRKPFARLYPGEPTTVDFELALDRRHCAAAQHRLLRSLRSAGRR